MAVLRGQVDGGRTLAVLLLRVCPVPGEHSSGIHVPVLGSVMQSRVIVRAGIVDTGPSLQEHFRYVCMAFLRRE